MIQVQAISEPINGNHSDDKVTNISSEKFRTFGGSYLLKRAHAHVLAVDHSNSEVGKRCDDGLL